MTLIQNILPILQTVNSAIRAEVLVRNYAKLDGAHRFAWGSATLTADAAECCKTDTVLDIGTVIQGLDAIQDNLGLKINQATVQIRSYSTDGHFVLIPFIVIMENGESIAATSGNETDPKTAIDDAVTGQFMMAIGDPIVSHEIRDNGSAVYFANGAIDIANICRKYADHIQTANLREESLLALELGAFAYMLGSNDTVTVRYLSHIGYSFAPLSSMI